MVVGGYTEDAAVILSVHTSFILSSLTNLLTHSLHSDKYVSMFIPILNKPLTDNDNIDSCSSIVMFAHKDPQTHSLRKIAGTSQVSAYV